MVMSKRKRLETQTRQVRNAQRAGEGPAHIEKIIDDWDRSGRAKTSVYWRLQAQLYAIDQDEEVEHIKTAVRALQGKEEDDPRLDPDVEVRRHRDAMLAHQGLKPEEDGP